MQIRIAKPEDCVKIYKMMEESHPEKGYYPEANSYDAIMGMLNIIRNGYVVIAENDDGWVIGVAACEWMGFFWNRQRKHLENILFTVHPDYRSGGVAKYLIEKLKAYCRENKADLIFRVTTHHQPQILDRFLKSQGLTYVGGSLYYEGSIEDEV